METLQNSVEFNSTIQSQPFELSAFPDRVARLNLLQKGVRFGRKIFPRGWGTFLRTVANYYPTAKLYPARMNDGDTLYLNLGESMCHDYFYNGKLVYELFTVEFLNEFLRLEDVCLDVGANLGYLTRLMANQVGRKGAVYAYEPNPTAFRLLQANTHDLPQAHIHQLAVSDIRGTAPFSVTANGTTSSLGQRDEAKRTINAPVNTLDSLTARLPRVDFLKIDVEGFEFQVMRGGLEMIQQHKPLIYFEFLDDYGRARSVSIKEYEALLQPLGYRLRWVSPNYPFDELTTTEPAYYVIAIPDTERWRGLV